VIAAAAGSEVVFGSILRFFLAGKAGFHPSNSLFIYLFFFFSFPTGMASNHQDEDAGRSSHAASARRSTLPRMSTFAYHTQRLRLMLKVDVPEPKLDDEHGSPTESHADSLATKDDQRSIMHSIRDSVGVDDMSIYMESQPEIVKVCRYRASKMD
jgi:hypothetical protein